MHDLDKEASPGSFFRKRKVPGNLILSLELKLGDGRSFIRTLLFSHTSIEYIPIDTHTFLPRLSSLGFRFVSFRFVYSAYSVYIIPIHERVKFQWRSQPSIETKRIFIVLLCSKRMSLSFQLSLVMRHNSTSIGQYLDSRLDKPSDIT